MHRSRNFPTLAESFLIALAGCALLFASSARAAAQDLLVSSSAGSSVLRFDGASGAAKGAFVAAGEGGLDTPQGLVFGPDGSLYVSSSGTNSVLRYDADGHFLDIFVAAASGDLARPQGLVFGPDGSLYVSSFANDSVIRFQGPFGEAPGALVDTYVLPGTGGLLQPTGLTFGPDGNLYVSSRGTDNVLRFQGPSGESPGALIDEFVKDGINGPDDPIGLIFAGDSSLLIASSGVNNRVLRYQGPSGSSPGAFLGIVIPVGAGGLGRPEGVALDADGNLYVGSSSNDSVVRWSAATGQIDTFVASGAGGLREPTYLTFLSAR